jgi:hypothetical protein
MNVQDIFRVRRLALAALVGAGGDPQPWQWRRAALEPCDEWVPQSVFFDDDQAAAVAADPGNAKRRPGPSF